MLDAHYCSVNRINHPLYLGSKSKKEHTFNPKAHGSTSTMFWTYNNMWVFLTNWNFTNKNG